MVWLCTPSFSPGKILPSIHSLIFYLLLNPLQSHFGFSQKFIETTLAKVTDLASNCQWENFGLLFQLTSKQHFTWPTITSFFGITYSFSSHTASAEFWVYLLFSLSFHLNPLTLFPWLNSHAFLIYCIYSLWINSVKLELKGLPWWSTG